jgi:hypothetical protein
MPLAAQTDPAHPPGSITGPIDLTPAERLGTLEGAGGSGHWRERDAGLGLRLSARLDGAAFQGDAPLDGKFRATLRAAKP